MAILIAHEHMGIYAIITGIEAGLKLAVVFLIRLVSSNYLLFYGVLLLLVSIINAGMYITVCMFKYQECRICLKAFDKKLLLEIFSFTWWTLFGNLTTVIRHQAVTILVNQAFTPIIVAARAVALQVSSFINIFSSNFNLGLYPPIIKYYAAGQKKEMYALIFNGTKITFFLMWIFALPLFLRMDYLLKLWLKNPPEYTVLFTCLAIGEPLINSLGMPVTTAARAPGKMRTYELTLGLIQIAIFPVTWLFLAYGGAAYTVFVVAIVANIIMLFVRLIIVHGLIGLPVYAFIVKVILPSVCVIVLTFIPAWVVNRLLPQDFLGTCAVGLFCVAISSACMYFIAFDKT